MMLLGWLTWNEALEWLGSWLPAGLRLPTAMVAVAGGVIAVFATLFAVATWLERKGLGRIQNRPGPNRVGPWGLFQPAADGLKMLIKEDLVPRGADPVVHFLAPLVALAPLTLAFAVLPYGRGLVPVPLEAGLVFFFAAGTFSELAAFMAGWSSHNKYSMLGALRAIAQMISFELPLIVSAAVVVILSGSLSLAVIVEGQTGYGWGWLPHWQVFTPPGLTAFLIFLTAATAEANRAPFDLPEGESELIGGFMTEYSGFKYAVFYMGEYFAMFAISGLVVTLFLGGWCAPLPWFDWVPTPVWFFGKVVALLAWFIWLRSTVPRLRVDQLLGFNWKFLFPLALMNLVSAGAWRLTAGWQFPGAVAVRWGLALGLVVGPFFALAWGLARHRAWGPREYRRVS